MNTTLAVRAHSSVSSSGDLSPLEVSNRSSSIVTRQDFLDALKAVTEDWNRDEKRNAAAHVLKHDPLLGLESVLALGLELIDLSLILCRNDVQKFQPDIVNQVTTLLDLGLTAHTKTRFRESFQEIAKLYDEAVIRARGTPVEEMPLPGRLKKLFELYFAPQFKEKRFTSAMIPDRPDLIEQVRRYFERLKAVSHTVTITEGLLRSEDVPATVTIQAVERFLVSELKDTPLLERALDRYLKRNPTGSMSDTRFRMAIVRGEVLEISSHTRYEVLRELLSSKVGEDRLMDLTRPIWNINDLLTVARAFKIPDAFSKVAELSRRYSHDRDPLLEATRVELLGRIQREIAPPDEAFDIIPPALSKNQRMVAEEIRMTCIEHEPTVVCSPTPILNWFKYRVQGGWTFFDLRSGESYYAEYAEKWIYKNELPAYRESSGGVTLCTPFGPLQVQGGRITTFLSTYDKSRIGDRYLFGVTQNDERDGRVVHVHELSSDGIRMTGMSFRVGRDSSIVVRFESGQEVIIPHQHDRHGSELSIKYLGSTRWIISVSCDNDYLLVGEQLFDLSGFNQARSTMDWDRYTEDIIVLPNGAIVDGSTGAYYPVSGHRPGDVIKRYGGGYIGSSTHNGKLLLHHVRGDGTYLESEEVNVPQEDLKVLGVDQAHGVALLGSEYRGLYTLKNGRLVEEQKDWDCRGLASRVLLCNGYLYCICVDHTKRDGQVTHASMSPSTRRLMKIKEDGRFEQVYSWQPPGWDEVLSVEYSCISSDGEPFLTFIEKLPSGQLRLNAFVNGRVQELPTDEGLLNSLRESSEGEAHYVFDLLGPKPSVYPSVALVELVGALERKSLSGLSRATLAVLEKSRSKLEGNSNALSDLMIARFTSAIRKSPELVVGEMPLTMTSIRENRKLAQSMLYELVPGLKDAIAAVLDYRPERSVNYLESSGGFVARGADPQSEVTVTLATLDKPFYGALVTDRLSRISEGGFTRGAVLEIKGDPTGSEHVTVTSARPGVITLAAPLNSKVTPLDGAHVERMGKTGILSAKVAPDTFVRYTFQQLPVSIAPVSQAAYMQKLSALSDRQREDLLSMPLALPASVEGYLAEIAHHPPMQRTLLIESWVRSRFYYEWEYKNSMRIRESMSLQERLTYMSYRISELKRQRGDVGADTRELEGKEFSGVCAESTLLMVAMLRRSGIAAEVLRGFLVTGTTIQSKSAHAWVAAYLLDSEGCFTLVELDGTGLSEVAERNLNPLLEQSQEEQMMAQGCIEGGSELSARVAVQDEIDLTDKALSRSGQTSVRSVQAPLARGAETLQFLVDTYSSFSALYSNVAERGEIVDSPKQYHEWMVDALNLIPELLTDDGVQFFRSLLIDGLRRRYGLSEKEAATIGSCMYCG
jgi:hypothetical protein